MAMAIDGGPEIREFRQQGASTGRLPKSVRLLGKRSIAPDRASQCSAAMYEFEVVTGNASYRAGERFFLTAGEAQRVYCVAGSA